MSDLHLVLYSPRIPQNVGAIGRLCAATCTVMHVIRPITFPMDDKALKRSAMDYWDHVELHLHDNWPACKDWLGDRRIWFFTRHTERLYTDVQYQSGDVLMFGNENHGVPDNMREELRESSVGMPILNPHTRSLNLAMASAVGLYEAIRQTRP
ncbi:tRNA (cytidine(34)-2'-O)-methyltransferase [bacterium]|nr:tRNA (cytidine(34)-2'-O)-methyltransferase [bacterium]